MELRDAYDQISVIHAQLAATERLRGLRALPVAFSGVLALLAATVQAWWIADPQRDVARWLSLWIGAAAISFLAAGCALAHRVRASGSRLSVANAVLALREFSPCLLAGAIVTAAVVYRAPEQLWLLPGIWQLLFGLGNLGAHRLLPPPALVVGALYFASGTTCLCEFGQDSLDPWAMGLPFAMGQITLAGILWWSYERKTAEVRA
jgi:phosphatidylserine synthase